MIADIKLQTTTIVKIVGVLLFFKVIGLLQTFTHTLRFYMDAPDYFTFRSIIYFVCMIIPFIFLIQFFAHLRHAHKDPVHFTSRENVLMSLKNAFNILKIYFIVMMGTKVVYFLMDVFMFFVR